MQSALPFTAHQRHTLFLSSLGGILEYYDFIIYIFLTPYIEKIFFHDSSAYIATLKTLAIFSVGYFIRPLGGILFSHFGDRYGRKVVFLFTILFMAIPSFMIGLLPGPDKIGSLAPLLLLFCRLLQGLALGGEIPGAITFVSEHIDKNKGLALATLFFGINFGLLLGSGTTTLLTVILTPSEMLDYGWRIPFLIGGIFGLFSIRFRQSLKETQSFSELDPEHLKPVPLLTLFRYAKTKVIVGFFLVSLGSVSVFFYLYWPQYLYNNFHYPYSEMMKLNTLGTMILSFTILIGGFVVDLLGPKKVYLLCSILLIIVTYPLFILFERGYNYLFFSYFLFSIVFGFIPSAYSTMLSRLFPTEIRYSGIAISYNIAYAFFGGLSPIICTLLIGQTQSVFAPAYYIIFIAMMGALVCIFNRNKTVP